MSYNAIPAKMLPIEKQLQVVNVRLISLKTLVALVPVLNVTINVLPVASLLAIAPAVQEQIDQQLSLLVNVIQDFMMTVPMPIVHRALKNAPHVRALQVLVLLVKTHQKD